MGYGVIESDGDSRLIDAGVLESPANATMPERLRMLYEQICEQLDRHRPGVLAVEQLFFARNVTTAISVGQARGVVLLAAAQRGLHVQEYSPSEVKHSIVGYGKAEKSQIQEMVRIILDLDAIPASDDAADAIAIAICHAHHTSGYGSYLNTGR